MAQLSPRHLAPLASPGGAALFYGLEHQVPVFDKGHTLVYTLATTNERPVTRPTPTGDRTMSTVTRIDWTVADGNVWGDEDGRHDMEKSLNNLVAMTEAALREAYPQATITVIRANIGGAVQELYCESDDEDGWVDDETREQIKEVANSAWDSGFWPVAAD